MIIKKKKKSVSNALECPSDEKRMIVSLDMHRMNAIRWIDKENMLVCVQPGMIGIDFHKQLQLRGVTLGHEPDSWEFSTVGGWVCGINIKQNKIGYILSALCFFVCLLLYTIWI